MCPVSNQADWHCDPYATVIEDGRIYGMGVADLKAAAVAMLFAARDAALQKPRGDVIVGLGAGGESGGFIGTKAMMDRGLRADVAVVGEPSELEITFCQRGAVWHEWHGRSRW
jgi:acetylornithine deacetylase